MSRSAERKLQRRCAEPAYNQKNRCRNPIDCSALRIRYGHCDRRLQSSDVDNIFQLVQSSLWQLSEPASREMCNGLGIDVGRGGAASRPSRTEGNVAFGSRYLD